MRAIRGCWAAICLTVPFSALVHAEPVAELPLQMTQRGELLISDDLNQPPAAPWRTSKGRWQIVDGALQSAELKSDMHAAVNRRAFKFTNAIFQFDFKLDGAKMVSLSINDAKEHVCRVLVQPGRFVVRKDDHDHEGPDQAVTFASEAVTLAPGTWHTITLELHGREMLARLDGTLVGYGAHDLIATEKHNFGFTCAGETASFRNLRVWDARPNPAWQPPSTASKPTAAVQ